MATKTEKKNSIRQQIIESAEIYSTYLAGKHFLYVYGNEHFEVLFPVDCFLHLTGIETNLSARAFYKNAKRGKLSNNQFYFSSRHPYDTAKRKLPCLKRLTELVNNTVCVLKNIETPHAKYKLSVTNLEFTLGLISQTAGHTEKEINLFLPMSLRVKDSSVEKAWVAILWILFFQKEN